MKTTSERVKVHCRLRPPNPEEKALGFGSCQGFKALAGKTGCSFRQAGKKLAKKYQFDSFLTQRTTQEEVFDTVAKPIIDGVLKGFNGTLFAYGQTGAGKTYTMMGGNNISARGIIPRSLDQLFAKVDQEQEEGEATYSVSVSYVQIYCEILTDLLCTDGISQHISIRETQDASKEGQQVYIEGATKVPVTSRDECLQILKEGSANRVTACTAMNAVSSRSHAVFIVNIERRESPLVCDGTVAETDETKGSPLYSHAKLLLIDLAGSERVDKSLKGHIRGTRMSELKSINLSLSALGNVILALSEGKKHIPFRDSKLTRLLSDSLGGNCRTALVLNVSPADRDSSETVSTLNFGLRAGSVSTSVRQNVEIDYKVMYFKLQAKLDEKDDRFHLLEVEAAKTSATVASKEVQLVKLQETNRDLLSEVDSLRRAMATKDGDESKWLKEIESIRSEYEEKIQEERKRCASTTKQQEETASEAVQEWNSIEAELETQKEEYLDALSKIRSLSEKLRKKDSETNARISELLEENASKDAKVKELTSALQVQSKALEDTEGELVRSRSSYVTKAKELDTVYTEKIQMLLDRVESLESKGKTFLDTRERSRTNNTGQVAASTFLTEAIDSARPANSRRVRSGPAPSGGGSRLNRALKARNGNTRTENAHRNSSAPKSKQANTRRSNYNHQQMRFVAKGVNSRRGVKSHAGNRCGNSRTKSTFTLSDPKLFGPR